MSEFHHERLKRPMPDEELQSRWSKVQQRMTDAGVDALIATVHTSYFGSIYKYLTDLMPAGQAYPQSVILMQAGAPHIVSFGPSKKRNVPPAFAVRENNLCENEPYFSAFHFTKDWEGKIAAGVLAPYAPKVIAVESCHTCINMIDYLKAEFPKARFVDVHDLIDSVQAIKSPREIANTLDAARTLDYAMRAVCLRLRPGTKEYELRNHLMAIMEKLAMEEFIVTIGSAPYDGVITPYPTNMQNREIQDGDQVYVEISAAGAGGHYVKLGRTFSLGQPSEQMIASHKTAQAVQAKLEALLNPGAEPAQIYKRYNEVLAKYDCLAEKGIFAHGQGYNFVERPAIMPEETMPLQKNMCIAAAVRALQVNGRGFIADSYLLEENGCKKLSSMPNDITVL